MRLNWLQLDLVDTLDAPLCIQLDQDDAPVAVSEPTTASSASLMPSTISTGRFASIDNEEDIDKLAESRLSKNTKRQTDWALR